MLTELTNDEQRYLEGYAAALQDIQYELTGDNCCSKSYDPMTCKSDIMHSYAFNMKDGGRHHFVSDYKSVKEIEETLLKEVAWDIQSDFDLIATAKLKSLYES
jgi:hypothetical protein